MTSTILSTLLNVAFLTVIGISSPTTFLAPVNLSPIALFYAIPKDITAASCAIKRDVINYSGTPGHEGAISNIKCYIFSLWRHCFAGTGAMKSILNPNRKMALLDYTFLRLFWKESIQYERISLIGTNLSARKVETV